MAAWTQPVLRWALTCLAITLAGQAPASACALPFFPERPIFRALPDSEARALAGALRLPSAHVVMIGHEADRWDGRVPPEYIPWVEFSRSTGKATSERQGVSLLTFDPQGRGPGTFHIVERGSRGWQAVVSIPFDPARQYVSVGDFEDSIPRGQPIPRGFRPFAVNPLHSSEGYIEEQRGFMRQAGYERRWAWPAGPSRQAQINSIFEKPPEGPLWTWGTKGYRRIAAGPKRDAYEQKIRSRNMCPRLP